MAIDLSQLDDFLPRNLRSCALRVAEHYQKLGYAIVLSSPIIAKALYEFHIVCKKKHEMVAIEIRERCEIPSQLEKAVDKCHTDRIAVKVYFAVPDKVIDSTKFDNKRDVTFTHAQLTWLEECGIGLLIVEDDKIVVQTDTVGCDRRFSIPSGTSLGNRKNKIESLVRDYNRGDCLNAVKSLAEEAEDETYDLALKASRKNKLPLTKHEIERKDWESVINALSADNYNRTTLPRVITDAKFTTSLKSFKDKRNLSHHKKSAKELKALNEQYPEAMLEGIRVIRGLVRLKNGLK